MQHSATIDSSAATSAALYAAVVFAGFVLMGLVGQSVLNDVDVVRAVVVSGAVSVAVGVGIYRRSKR
ncbi:hypothetical protein [Halomarina oriensis]|uniref:Uncharacterized protein n=1 Tax=Halomarina oriensis TaxID=671145 RepID=A0A6B0GMY8_9EURY|nr:hypothetical protein [Halomarina oriensis]MWG35301.1 hypothetical protein [Halomarina oriensis]